MEINISPRQSGKTTKMIAWLKQNDNAVLLVHNHQERMRLINNCELNPSQSARIMTYDAWLGGYILASKDVKIAVDNAEIFLQRVFGGRLRKASISSNDPANTVTIQL